MGATSQDLQNRKAFGHQPDPSAHDPRNDTLVYAAWAEGKKHLKYDNLRAAAGTILQPFALETMGGHGASTKAVYYLFTKHLRDSGVPPPGGEALKRKLKKDISFALRRGTIAQVTTALDAASAPPRRSSPLTMRRHVVVAQRRVVLREVRVERARHLVERGGEARVDVEPRDVGDVGVHEHRAASPERLERGLHELRRLVV
jgi:hypothetical protein